jgi:TetR/AcrR family transcriptional regulator, regulator of autoinduction and epiphytic fitness
VPAVLPDHGQPLDGRLLRTARTRSAIVGSYIELLGRGDRAPSAERIAQHAGVGIRTVYNQFRDLEGLRREVGALVWQQLGQYVVRDVAAGSSLDERLDLFIRMRVQLLEALTPYARSAQGHHDESGELRRGRTAMIEASKRELAMVFAPELARRNGRRPRQFLDALHIASSWPPWAALRDELGLDVSDAAAVLRITLDALLRS